MPGVLLEFDSARITMGHPVGDHRSGFFIFFCLGCMLFVSLNKRGDQCLCPVGS